jgi:hypothetical protein
MQAKVNVDAATSLAATRISASTKKAMLKRAHAEGMTMSTWLRRLIILALRNG